MDVLVCYEKEWDADYDISEVEAGLIIRTLKERVPNPCEPSSVSQRRALMRRLVIYCRFLELFGLYLNEMHHIFAV